MIAIEPRGVNVFVYTHVTSAPLRIVTLTGSVRAAEESVQCTDVSRHVPCGELGSRSSIS